MIPPRLDSPLSRLLPLLGALLLVAAAPPTDSDGDGLDDAWERRYFGDTAAWGGADDPDADGLDNAREQALGTSPILRDSDGDGLADPDEADSPQGLDPTRADTDGDLLRDGEELALGTSPSDPDSDADGLSDHLERELGLNPLDSDTDGGWVLDGEELLVLGSDPFDPRDDRLDSDGDGLTNYLEVALGTNPFNTDSDGDLLLDGEEDADRDGQRGEDETDPLAVDSDGDGLSDGIERLVHETDPLVADSDGDGYPDGEEIALQATTFGCLDPSEPDSDFDGLPDGEETLGHGSSSPCVADTDGGGVFDAVELALGRDPGDASDDLGQDSDGDGLADLYERGVLGSDPLALDSDGDGLDDGQEALPLSDRLVTDPTDADSDDDGLLDGQEGGVLDHGEVAGGTDPTAADSDGDGLLDGLEVGLEAPRLSPVEGHQGDTRRDLFEGDLDPSTTTDPTAADSDEDGLLDGAEDADHDGRVAADETDPNDFDTDGDDIDDGWEVRYGDRARCPQGTPLDPLSAGDRDWDRDGDGLSAFAEYKLVKLAGGALVPNDTNPCDRDSDDDGLCDGFEVEAVYVPGLAGLGGTDPNAADSDGDGIPDGVEDADGDGRWDPGLETSPRIKDTDGDMLSDGAEDLDHDGLVDPGETDPRVLDSDGDGLGDGEERWLITTDPLAVDSDGDGLPDGLEVGRVGDTDPATVTNPVRADMDGDGLLDGEEDADGDGAWGAGETDPARVDSDGDGLGDGLELGAGGDLDPASVTDPLARDSDHDGLWDGQEDANRNGRVDAGEPDPGDPDSDDGGVVDGAEVLVDGTDPLDPSDDATADADGDGLTNSEEWRLGTDPRSVDSDGDTLDDLLEVGEDPLTPADWDGDGRIDALDVDSDGDGLPDRVEAGDADPRTAPVDSDGDGAPDYLDLDSDGDTLPDALEEQGDADADGIPDADADGDGLPNRLDSDSDADGLLDREEGLVDVDADGIVAYLDPCDSLRGGFEPGASITGGCQGGGPQGAQLAVIGLALLLLLAARGRWRRGAVMLVAAVASSVAAHAARADAHPDGRHTALNGNRLQLTADGSGVFATPGADLAGAMEVRAGLSLQGMTTSLRVARGDTTLRELVTDRWEIAPSAAAGLFDLFEVAASLPIVLTQAATYPGLELGPVSSTGIGDLALALRARPWPTRAGALGVAGGLTMTLPTGDAGAYMGAGGVTLRADAGVDYSLGPARVVFDLAYLAQPSTSLLNVHHDDQLLAALGGVLDLSAVGGGLPLEVGLDLQVATRASAPLASAAETSVELLVGARMRFGAGGMFVGRVGGGGSPVSGYATPGGRWFAAVGARFNEVRDLDRDGIVDDVDACPREAEDRDGWGDDDGCPDPDNDGDGVADEQDACPDVAGDADHDGCPPGDGDGDGVPDSVDECPGDPEDIDGDADEDGCPDIILDADGDGVADAVDVCPALAEDPDGFEDDDGCPDVDNDADAVLDPDDACPDAPEVVNGFEDEDGCPDKLVELSVAKKKIIVQQKIHFRYMDFHIEPRSWPLLNRVAEVLIASPHVTLLQIEGHTDAFGNAAENKQLSYRRALAVSRYLIACGVERERLIPVGFGQERLVDRGLGLAAARHNRRVEFNIIGLEKVGRRLDDRPAGREAGEDAASGDAEARPDDPDGDSGGAGDAAPGE